MLEGRRMTDLGIRLPLSQEEINTNPNISEGDTGTVPFVPTIIPAQTEMDQFSPATLYDDDGNLVPPAEITCLWDMNRVLAESWTTFGPVAGPPGN